MITLRRMTSRHKASSFPNITRMVLCFLRYRFLLNSPLFIHWGRSQRILMVPSQATGTIEGENDENHEKCQRRMYCFKEKTLILEIDCCWYQYEKEKPKERAKECCCSSCLVGGRFFWWCCKKKWRW